MLGSEHREEVMNGRAVSKIHKHATDKGHKNIRTKTQADKMYTRRRGERKLI